jgi:hypothetical protein
MLHSLPRLKSEYPFEYKYESWNKMLDNGIPLSHSWPARPPTPVAAPPTTPTTAPAATTPANTSALVTVPPSTPAAAPAPATPAEPSVL